MKSIRYLLSGKPGNVDDCLDLSKKRRLELVALSLDTEENVTEMYVMKSLFGIFDWKFENNNIRVEQVFGGYFLTDSDQRKKINIAGADRRLRNVINKIEKLHVNVIGKERRFDVSIIISKEEQ